MSLLIVIACEAEADFRAASTLIDRVLVEQIDWLESDHLEYVRRYDSVESAHKWTRLQSIPTMVIAKSLKAKMGHFQGEPGAPDALLARKAILLLSSIKPRPDLLLVMRDTDKHPQRKTGWDCARKEYHGGPPLVLGIAIIKRENWILAGFQSRNEEEKLRLQSERQRLGYDPSLHPHLANSHEYRSKHCPKQVLENLVGKAELDREIECLRDTPLVELHSRGESVGLTEFLKEIEMTICPLLRRTQKP